MAAVYYDILIEQGATYLRTFVWKDSDEVPVDLTNYTARMQIRRKRSSTTVEHTATTENGGIVLGGTAGTIDIIIPATATAEFDFTKGVYDLELESTGNVVTRLIEGSVEVSKEVTR
jgi:hypothetical protein